MLLSQSCIYAIKAVLYLAREYNAEDDSYTSTRDIGNELDISFHFLSKVLNKLAESGVIVTYRGPKGGVKLSKPPSEITLSEITKAVEGKEVLDKCLLGDEHFEKHFLSEFHKRWKISREFLHDKLWKATLHELAQQKKINS